MKKMKNIMTVVLSLMLVLSLAACEGLPAASEPAAEPVTGSGISSDLDLQEQLERVRKGTVSEVQASAVEPASKPSTSSSIRARLERIRKAQEQKKDSSAASSAKTESKADRSSVAAVAKLGELTGTGELVNYRTGTGEMVNYEMHDTVDVNDKHNPYDLVWQYGDKENEKGGDFGKLYASYVDAVDWSLVFDAEYYKKAFPMLAKLYHQDDALLLEHFQTVGIHEGRQGSKKFNVSVYMANCEDALVEAFGENYECYYFYYMLNYAAERKVSTAGTYGKDPLWLGLELTAAQKKELERANWYRDELDVGPLVMDPENIAFANYRAWYNAVNSLRGHGWLEDEHNPDVNEVFDLLGVNHLSENTVTKTGTATKNSTMMPYSASYRSSESHYKAMVNERNLYFGVSHMYYNGDSNWMTEFDTFLREKPVPDYTMR